VARVRPVAVVVDPPASMTRRAIGKPLNRCSLRHSSRKRPFARGDLPVWRRDDGTPMALRITKRGLKEIAVDEAGDNADALKQPQTADQTTATAELKPVCQRVQICTPNNSQSQFTRGEGQFARAPGYDRSLKPSGTSPKTLRITASSTRPNWCRLAGRTEERHHPDVLALNRYDSVAPHGSRVVWTPAMRWTRAQVRRALPRPCAALTSRVHAHRFARRSIALQK
jgi:hypothetical protein